MKSINALLKMFSTCDVDHSYNVVPHVLSLNAAGNVCISVIGYEYILYMCCTHSLCKDTKLEQTGISKAKKFGQFIDLTFWPVAYPDFSFLRFPFLIFFNSSGMIDYLNGW